MMHVFYFNVQHYHHRRHQRSFGNIQQEECKRTKQHRGRHTSVLKELFLDEIEETIDKRDTVAPQWSPEPETRQIQKQDGQCRSKSAGVRTSSNYLFLVRSFGNFCVRKLRKPTVPPGLEAVRSKESSRVSQ